MDGSGRKAMLLPRRIEPVPSARTASPETLRLCSCERDAVLVSLQLSNCTLDEIGARIGVSKQAVSKWARDGVPSRRVRAFCNATGTNLLLQFIDLQRALRIVSGHPRECDRIADIASHEAAA